MRTNKNRSGQKNILLTVSSALDQGEKRRIEVSSGKTVSQAIKDEGIAPSGNFDVFDATGQVVSNHPVTQVAEETVYVGPKSVAGGGIEPIYECTECEKSFPEEDRLEQHVSAKHTESDDDWDDELEPMQVEHVHTIKVTHVQRKEIRLRPPRKAADRVVTLMGRGLRDPESLSSNENKTIYASGLNVAQGHNDPAYRSGKTIVEEYVDYDYDSDNDDDESWIEIVVICECGNKAATDCANDSCGTCCEGDCQRHG